MIQEMVFRQLSVIHHRQREEGLPRAAVVQGVVRHNGRVGVLLVQVQP